MGSNYAIPALGGGIWETIGDATAAGDANVGFTWAKTYKKVVCTVNQALGNTNLRELLARTSPDGSGFDSGVGDYAWAARSASFATTPTLEEDGDNSNSSIVLCSDAVRPGSAANEGLTFVAQILFPAQATYTVILSQGIMVDGSTIPYEFTGAGWRLDAAAVLGIQFRFVNGTIATGEFTCHGLL